MPTPTYTPLANITLGSSAASVTFSSISGSYRDLILIITGTSDGTVNWKLNFNSDTGSNYPSVEMTGNGATTSSSAGTNAFANIAYWPSTGNRANAIVNIMDYSATDKHKSFLSRADDPSGRTAAYAGRWSNTAAITTMVLSMSSGNIASGSTFALYGIVA